MPADYSSFQIKNTTGGMITVSVTDPDGRELTVGKLKPGQESHQVAPVGASWTLKQSDLETGSPVTAPAPSSQIIISPVLLDTPTGKESAPEPQGYSVEFIDDTPQLLGGPINFGPTEYEAFLKLETGSHTGRINQLLVTPDGKSLITSGEDKTIRVWDIETRKQTGLLLGQIGDGDEGKIQAIALSPDGKYLAALIWVYPEKPNEGKREGEVRESDLRVFELATGNLQARHHYAGTLFDLDFSPDGTYAALSCNPKNFVEDYEGRRGYVCLFESKEILQGFGTLPSARKDHVQEVYHTYSWNIVMPTYVRFIPQEEGATAEPRLVVATWIYNQGPGAEYNGKLYWYTCSREGLKEIQSCNTAENLPKQADPSGLYSIPPISLAVSREFVITISDHRDLKEFFCHNHAGELVASVLSETVPAQPAFSKDGSQLIVGQRDDSDLVQIKVYNTAGGQFQLKSTYYSHSGDVKAVALLDDGTAVSAGGDQNAIHFWSTAHSEGKQNGDIRGIGRTVRAVGISEQEQIGIGNRKNMLLEDGTIAFQWIFDLRSLTLRSFSLQDHYADYQRSQTFREEKNLVFEVREPYVNLYLDPLSLPLIHGDWYFPTTFGFTQSGSVVTGADDGKVRIVARERNDWQDQEDRFLVGHTAGVLDHAASSKWLVTAGRDQIIRLWYVEDVEQEEIGTLEPALNLFVGVDDEWVLWSKSGYYTASQNGERYLGYHVNRGAEREALFFSSDRFRNVFYRTDIIQAILTYGSEERVSQQATASQLSVAPVNVAAILPPIIELDRDGAEVYESADTRTGFVKFTLSVESHGKPVTRITVLRNGRLIYVVPPGQNSIRRLRLTLPLLPGRNQFKLFAENQDSQSNTIRSNPVEQEIAGKERYEDQPVLENGTLYLLSIGVGKGVKLRPRGEGGTEELRFAKEDADAIARAFERNSAFERVEPPVKLVNEQATRAGILQALDALCQKITETVEARVENNQPPRRDALIVFLSGHGVYRLKDRQLYFWNYEFDPDNPDETGLSFMALGERITSLPADVILMTDACHSGMAGSDVMKGFDPDQGEIDPNELAARIYGINESDMYIFNAARRSEFAVEGSSVDHGYFTKAILDTLAASAGRPVTMIRLIDEVQWRVPQDKQHPVCRIYGDLMPMEIYRNGLLSAT